MSRIFLAIAVLFSLGLTAQVTPVQVTVVLNSNSVYPEDFTEPGAAIVTLLLLDDGAGSNRDNLPVLLDLSIKDRSNVDFRTAPANRRMLTLQPNIPLVLTGAQLRPFFDALIESAFLEGRGADAGAVDFGKAGIVLQEGMVELCAEVFLADFPDLPGISNQACGLTLAQLQDPPFNLVPDRQVEANPDDVVPFAWLPGHTAAGPVFYRLTVWEAPYFGASTIDIATFGAPVNTVETMSSESFYNWSVYDGRLTPGRDYAYVVRVIDRTGRANFKNDGFSEFARFSYGEPDETVVISPDCYEPRNFRAVFTGVDEQLQLNWQGRKAPKSGHTITVRRPDGRFVLQTAPDNTPRTLPRKRIKGSTLAYTYATTLANGPGRAGYEIELCVDCPDGTKNCQIVTIAGDPTAPADTTTTTDSTAVDSLNCSPVVQPEVLAAGGDAVRLVWSALSGVEKYYLSWARIVPDPRGQQRDQRAAPAGREQAGEDGLGGDDRVPGAGGAPPNPGMNPGNPSGNDSPPARSTEGQRVPVGGITLEKDATETTVTLLEPGEMYEFTFCRTCVDGTQECTTWVEDFEGCRAEFSPVLVAMNAGSALIGWGEPGNVAERSEGRYEMQVFGNRLALEPGQLGNFAAENYDYLPEQLATTQRLNKYLVYAASVRTACADSALSAWSDPVLFSLNCRLTDSLAVAEITDTSAILSTADRENARYFVFEYRAVGQADWTLSRQRRRPDLSLRDLLPNTNYEARVRYYCDARMWSNYGETVTFTTLPACAPPTEVIISEVGTDLFTLSWTPAEYATETVVTYQNATRLNYYALIRSFGGRVRSARRRAQRALGVHRVRTSDSTMLIDGLIGGAEYNYNLKSNCSVNVSELTATDTATLNCAPPGMVAAVNTQPTATLVILRRTSPTLTRNRLDYRALGDTDWLTSGTGRSGGKLDSLNDLTTYELRATSTCRSGQDSPPSDTIQFSTPVDCRTPDELMVTNLETNTATIAWATTGSVSQWEVRYRPTSGRAALDNRIQNQAAMTGRGFDTRTETMGDIRGGSPGAPGNPTTSTTSNAPPPEVDPYASWQVMLVDEPRVTLGLSIATDYELIVRAQCPTDVTTDWSAPIRLRTLCSDAAPSDAVADNLLSASAELNWRASSGCWTGSQVQLEQLNNFDKSGPAQRRGIRATNDPVREIFVEGRDYRAQGLVANTNYRYRVQTRFQYRTWAGEQDDDGRYVGSQDYGQYGAWTSFQTDECATPVNFVENTLDKSTVEVTWTPSAGVNQYDFQYKLATEGDNSWITFPPVAEPYVVVENVLRGELYDYRVAEVCRDGGVLAGVPGQFGVERVSLANGLYACGVLTDVDVSNQTPMAGLSVGDTIMAYDFKVALTRVQGGNGRFTGEGTISVPYFNKAKAKFTFDNIFVNDEARMTDGYMGFGGAGLDILPPWAEGILNAVMEVAGILDQLARAQQIIEMQKLMTCCPGSLSPYAIRQMTAFLDCFERANTDEEIEACDVVMQAGMGDLIESLDSTIAGFDTLIWESVTMDIIREAVVEVEGERLPTYGDYRSAYDVAKAKLTDNYAPLGGGGTEDESFDFELEVEEYDSGTIPSSPNRDITTGTAGYQSSVKALERTARTLVMESIFTTTDAKLNSHAKLKELALSLREGDEDIYQTIRDGVDAAQNDNPEINILEGPERDRLRTVARNMFLAKIQFLIGE
ncbi:fibronectin type III domain-containing protein [Neolewinella antarctica]|uniref:Fibronectin type-III domain-containing protein n=1 Tax=Neolewinella antarctica TaxID=442734 RepID=A0ABX0XEP6_9BACT|nr:fibronectin type III domain-containing protein [Neolewinella antarctica]NJC27687.1 hypothetical protein [Neolewinella antarctica]